MKYITYKSNKWLAKKFFMFSIGVYATIACIFSLKWLGLVLGIISPFNLLTAFFLTVYVRTFYEQLVILDIPPRYINSRKNILFALLYAVIMSIVFYIIRVPLGLWGIPVAMVVVQVLIKPIKARLWESKPRPGLYELYSQKQGAFMISLYGFYGLLACITVVGVKILHLSFCFAFFIGIFMALLASSLYELHNLYERNIDGKIVCQWLFMAFLLGCLTSAIVTIAITKIGIPGSTATIIGCIAVKVAQHFALRVSL